MVSRVALEDLAVPRPSVLPSAHFGISAFGELLSDPSRVAMLLSLMDGRARPATELGDIARVTRPTASSHLRRLLEGEMVSVERIGRHRYFRLKSEQVADLLETLALFGPPPRPAHEDPVRRALAHARTCYRHLAGQLGVAFLDALEQKGLLCVADGTLALAQGGVASFESLGLKVERWPTGKACLDWTERRHHLGGELGALLTRHLFTVGWLRRGEGRAVEVSRAGEREFARRFGLPASLLRP